MDMVQKKEKKLHSKRSERAEQIVAVSASSLRENYKLGVRLSPNFSILHHHSLTQLRTVMTQSPSAQLSERYIQDSFHSYLKSSLTQAKAERLLDSDVLSSAESDLMITGEDLHYVFTLQLLDVPQTHLPSLYPAPKPPDLQLTSHQPTVHPYSYPFS
ncbi:hypothetical protein H0H93_002984 [Arthromyces matolae]|nr:hypothetical protein H0H93_002984 [Arthromyces matolae]